MTHNPLYKLALGVTAETYIVENLENGNAFSQELVSRARRARSIWTWAPRDVSEYTSRLQFGGVFTLKETTEIYDSLVAFVNNYLQQGTGEILIVLNQLARPSDPFLQNKSGFFVWENTVNFFVIGAGSKIDDIEQCFREKRGYPPIAFLTRAPDVEIASRVQLHRHELIALTQGMTHLIIGIFDEESYMVEEVT